MVLAAPGGASKMLRMEPLVPVVLAGRHVRREPLSVAHVPGLCRAATGESRQSFHWTYVPPDEAAMRAYVDVALDDQGHGRAIPFATLRDGEVVGSTRFGNVERWMWI